MKRLSEEALAVLADGIRVHEHVVHIEAQLDRKLYVQVNAALEALGGKWNRKLKVHVFGDDPRDSLDQVLSDGGFHDVKQDLDQFYTPYELAVKVVARAGVDGKRVLEPSAGSGALVSVAFLEGADSVHALDIDEKNVRALFESQVPGPGTLLAALHQDFLAWTPKQAGKPFDVVVMNPPFSRQRDIEHVTHALKFLASDGRLVAIMSAGVEFRQDRKARQFREMVQERGGSIERLPEGSFKSSGTGVNTVLVTIGGL